jgi:hypothetical protein
MFRALHAHPQESLHKRHLVYCVRVMSVGYGTVAVSLQTCHSQLTLHARSIPNAVCAETPEDEHVMLETCRDPLILNKLNEKCITLVSLYWYSDVMFLCNVIYSESGAGMTLKSDRQGFIFRQGRALFPCHRLWRPSVFLSSDFRGIFPRRKAA